MVFLKSHNDNDMNALQKYFKASQAHNFILIFMEGCGPCNDTRPEWSKLENVLNKHTSDKDVVIADVETQKLQDMDLPGFEKPTSFPTIVYVHNGTREEYTGERNIDSFVNWINSKLRQNKKGGNKTKKQTKTKKHSKWSAKYKRSINCNRPKGFSQKQYCKYSRKKIV